jgi:hypothetical protein
MVNVGYTVIVADVVRRTERVAVIRLQEGPRKGEDLTVPITVFEDPPLVEKDDDEIVLADWYARKEGLLSDSVA